MHFPLLFSLLLVFCFGFARANTEKIIFLGPSTVNVPATQPTLGDLRLDVLTPDDWSRRLHLQASFPDAESPLGTTSWLLLTNLTLHQCYELRVCWAATQPTAFSLDVFELPVVWDTPELITSLASFAFARQPDVDTNHPLSTPLPGGHEYEASLLFLRISAAADYFTDNATLMAHVENVSVDVILDPFLLNALPSSLLPTIFYALAVAVLACSLSRVILAGIQTVLAAEGKLETQKKRL
ncbi:hypothetical protein CSOJ01_00152 [Colletotrichum sojae]|uniref:Uncharacterized protein n=1 Tax=Colletotrichum sojae TaxID=2175907 RepID=A0A8H6JY78_9PEZI|nr:hypothetical protein CSOJ01_00152 [Colletotrichum sojae]